MANPPLLVVTLLFRAKPALCQLSHVVDAVSVYADASVQLPLARAVKFGSLALLNRIWTCQLDLESDLNASWSVRSLLRTESRYQWAQANGALLEAVKRRDLVLIQWVFDRFPSFSILEDVVEEAVATGDLEILNYLKHKDINHTEHPDQVELDREYIVQWGCDDMARAAAAGHRHVVEWLQTAEEYGDRDLQAAMKAAVAHGDRELVDCVQRVTHIPATKYVVEAAAHGHVHLLEWLDEEIYSGKTAGMMIKAAENGHLNVVQWLIERDWNDEDLDSEGESDDDYYDGGYGGYGWGRDYNKVVQPFHVTSVGGEASLAIHTAAINGHLEVAQYLHARVDTPLGKRDDEKLRQRRMEVTRKKLKEQLGKESEALSEVSAKTMLIAAKKGLLDVVQWLYNEDHIDPAIDILGGVEYIGDKKFTAMDFAASNGHFEVLRYLHDVGKSFQRCVKPKRYHPNSLNSLLKHFSESKKLVQTTPPTRTTQAMDGAAAHGHLDIVRWLHGNGTEGCTTAAMDLAARNGHLEVVQWLYFNRKEGCTEQAMDGAASDGHLAVVKWLHENKNEGCSTKAMDGAASGGHLQLVKWLHANRTEGCTVAAMDGAAACGALEVVKFLSRNRSEGCTTKAMDGAARCGHIRVVRWLHENRTEGCTLAAMDDALMAGHFEVILFLQKHRSEGLTKGDERVEPEASYLHAWADETYHDPEPQEQ